MLYHNTFIIPPSPDEVQKYLLKWDNLGSYVVQEEALNDFIRFSKKLWFRRFQFKTN